MSQNKTQAKSARAKIVVVDDHPVFRAGLAQLVDRQPDLLCCGQADSVASTKAGFAKFKPDLVLLDLRLADGDSLELIKWLAAQSPGLRILVISQYDEVTYAELALDAGAAGYINKSEAAEEVLAAIRSVLAGAPYVSHRLSVKLLAELLARKPETVASGIAGLTDREFQVFEMIGAGLGTQRISTALYLSPKTIETYREHLKHKLRLPDAAALSQKASEWLSRQTRLPFAVKSPIRA
jgi:DNA-binding NarL/FixJ family response regulator